MSGIQQDTLDYFLKFRDPVVFNDKNSVWECFKRFDKDQDGYLDINEFENLLKSLFSYSGNSYFMSKTKIKTMFSYFDSSKINKHNITDFEKFWQSIVKQTLFPRSAFLIVDVQNDFIDGTLSLSRCPAKQDGGEVVPVINHLIDTVKFDAIVYSLDWHPKDHCSFIENVGMRQLSVNSPHKTNIKTYDIVIYEEYPEIEQKLWPAHCVQGTSGAQLHPSLKVVEESTDPMKRAVIYTKKGSRSDIDSYSAFFDNCKLNETTLHGDLKKHNITDLYVCGLAADVCVAATSFHGLDLHYRVIYVEDASRGVDITDIENQKKKLISQGALMVNSKQVANMVLCKDRRPELGYATFLKLVHDETLNGKKSENQNQNGSHY